MRIIGIDPGLVHTGIGIIDYDGFKLKKVFCSVINTNTKVSISERLVILYKDILHIMQTYNPNVCSIEKVFVNMNPESSLKLGLARGVALCVPAIYGIEVFEYTPNKVKKTVVGNGHATKDQIGKMVQVLLGGVLEKKDAADALAIAICHANHTNAVRLV